MIPSSQDIPPSMEISYDDKISPTSQRIIKKLGQGSRLLFEEIIVQDSYNEIRRLSGFSILIK